MLITGCEDDFHLFNKLIAERKFPFNELEHLKVEKIVLWRSDEHLKEFIQFVEHVCRKSLGLERLHLEIRMQIGDKATVKTFDRKKAFMRLIEAITPAREL